VSDRLLNRHRRTFSASRAVEVAGQVLREIKAEDGLTFKELGKVLGKGADQAEKIAKGNSVMDMPTFLAACDYWGERFADKVLKLAHLRTAPCGAKCSTDHDGGLALARLLPPILEAEADGEADADELRPHEALIRKVHQKTQHWLETIAEPVEPVLRAVGEGR
jgi:transcriptional regulator with XRE-family HTH domain